MAGVAQARAKDAQTIYNEIVAHINKQGGPRSSWYVGITQDVDQRLFGTHKVPREGHWYIYREANTAQAARNIEKALLEWGCDGGTGGGDSNAEFVYAYLMTAVTDP